MVNKTTELFVKHFNCDMHDEDNGKISKEEAQQSIAVRGLGATRQNNIVNHKTKQHIRQHKLSSSKPIAPSPASVIDFNSSQCHRKSACCKKEVATMKF